MNPLLSKVIRNEHQQQKYEQLELLASQANGRIVELGAYLGYGTIALCTGAAKGTMVYTVDDYQNRKGWAGEVYYPNDKQAFERNCKLANVLPILIERDVQVAAGEWPGVSISLLVWDLGIPARLCEDFGAWASHVVKGGKFVIHDTDDNRLGSDLLNPLGWSKYKEGVFWILERKL